MLIDLSMEALVALGLGVAGTIAAARGRAAEAENKTLKNEIRSLREQYTVDIKRIDESHEDIWQEIKVQRESLAQNREAILRLTSSIERLNEILPRLELAISDKVSDKQCEMIRQNCADRRQYGSAGRRIDLVRDMPINGE